MKAYELSTRARPEYGPGGLQAVCGLALGHYGNCLTEEAVRNDRRRRNERRRQTRRS